MTVQMAILSPGYSAVCLVYAGDADGCGFVIHGIVAQPLDILLLCGLHQFGVAYVFQNFARP